MEVALKGIPEETPPNPPEGIRSVMINPKTGLPTDNDGVLEYFYDENAPSKNSGMFF